MGESLSRAAKALADFCRAVADVVSDIVISEAFRELLEAAAKQTAKEKVALAEAPLRVRRLALYGKKYRTRKKNINRALREKAKREADKRRMSRRTKPVV
jgi:hypothetical protein